MSTYDSLDAIQGRIRVANQLPTTPLGYYAGEVNVDAWKGGEIIYHSGTNQLYIQTATSGVDATWKRLATAFATSTTSSSSSSSTSTSTSSSSSSSSTSSSSTTTMP